VQDPVENPRTAEKEEEWKKRIIGESISNQKSK
jgi:hypothetical protein